MPSFRHITALLLVGFIASFQQTQAQTNFRPGYVLPLTGDTLRGEVDSRDGRANAQRCRFRTTPEAPITTYSPVELRGYGLPSQNKHYRAMRVPSASGDSQPYFFEVLVDGPAVLYFLRDAQQHESYYVFSPKAALTQLEYRQVPVTRDGRSYISEQTPYRDVLVAALVGCPEAQSQLSDLPFQESALRKVVTRYNECQGYRVARPEKAAVAGHVTFGLLAGVVQHTLTYRGAPYVDEAVTGRQVGYAVGPVLRFSLDRLSQKLSLVVAALYEPEKHELLTPNKPNGSPADVRNRSRFDLAYLRLPVMLRYTYPRGTIRPVAEAGITPAYAFRGKNTIEQAYYTPDYSKPQPLLSGSAFRLYQVGFGAGVGATMPAVGGRSATFLARAEITNGFSGVAGTGTSVLHLYGLLSFDLTK